MANDPGPQAPPTRRLRWDIVALSFLYGGVAIFSGAMFAYGRVSVSPDVSGFWSGLLVNVGTTILLAGALIWFERAIVEKVNQASRDTLASVHTANEDAITRAADAAAARVSQDAEDLKIRLDELDSRLRAEELNARRARVHRAAQIKDTYDFPTIAAAMEEAGSIRAISSESDRVTGDGDAHVVVTAGEPIVGSRLKVTFRRSFFEEEPGELLISLMGGAGDPVRWADGEALEDEVWKTLTRKALRDKGGTVVLSAEAFVSNLSEGIKEAISSRQGSQPAWLSGEPLIEWVAPGIAITDAGVEVRGQGVVLSAADMAGFLPNTNLQNSNSYALLPPKNVDKATWDEVVARAEEHLLPRFL